MQKVKLREEGITDDTFDREAAGITIKPLARVAEIIRDGACLPRYRAPLGEIQSFYGRPGRPRSKALRDAGRSTRTR